MEKWEREALFTYYDADGNYVFEQNLGVRLRGTSTRDGIQKDFSLIARSEYDGNDTIQYSLFSIPTDSLILRHRDITQKEGFLSSLVSDRDLTTQEYQMVNLYLNGEFWGVYSLLTRVDEYFLSNRYGVDESNIAFVKINHFAEGSDEAMQYYQQLMTFISSNDLSVDANYQKVCNMIDIQSLIDWYVVNSYWNNIEANIFTMPLRTNRTCTMITSTGRSSGTCTANPLSSTIPGASTRCSISITSTRSRTSITR